MAINTSTYIFEVFHRDILVYTMLSMKTIRPSWKEIQTLCDAAWQLVRPGTLSAAPSLGPCDHGFVISGIVSARVAYQGFQPANNNLTEIQQPTRPQWLTFYSHYT